jgi:hypothetical protein
MRSCSEKQQLLDWLNLAGGTGHGLWFLPPTFFRCWVYLHFLPSIVALARSTRTTLSIFLLNCFLGWTRVGWVVALTCVGDESGGLSVTSSLGEQGAYPGSRIAALGLRTLAEECDKSTFPLPTLCDPQG